MELNMNNKIEQNYSFNDGNSLKHHTSILGTTGQGKSTVFPNCIIITPNKIEQDEINKKIKISQLKRKSKENALDVALKNASLSNIVDEGELDTIYCFLHEELNVDIDFSMVSKVFMMLPQQIIGNGIQWGFSDTEVRDSIYVFLENNKSDILNVF
jgi:hypothetical protein